MILPPDFDTVASWYFRGPGWDVPLHILAARMQAALEVLETEGLLKVRTVSLRNPQGEELRLIAGELAAARFADACMTAAAELARRGAIEVSEVHVQGRGTILDADGRPTVYAGVVDLAGYRDAEPLIDVSTRADAWLPLTLLCEPQAEVHAPNATRLERALQAIEARLGVPGDPAPENENADIVGYRLRNVGLDFNDPIVPPRLERALGLST